MVSNFYAKVNRSSKIFSVILMCISDRNRRRFSPILDLLQAYFLKPVWPIAVPRFLDHQIQHSVTRNVGMAEPGNTRKRSFRRTLGNRHGKSSLTHKANEEVFTWSVKGNLNQTIFSKIIKKIRSEWAVLISTCVAIITNTLSNIFQTLSEAGEILWCYWPKKSTNKVESKKRQNRQLYINLDKRRLVQHS